MKYINENENLSILLLLFLTVYGNTYDCSTKNDTIILSLNEIAFFSTTNFPALLTRHKFESCTKTFHLGDENVKNYRTVFAVREYYQSGTNIGEYSLFSNINTSDYSMENYLGKFSLSQQIQILFEDFNTSCPLESISPFKFIDETQIIYLKSTYDAEDLINNFNRNYSCSWEFSAPQGYGFKIVFQVLNLATLTKLRIHNSTDIIVSERSATINRAYYNEDIYLSIYLSETLPMALTDLEFQAYITIVKKNLTKTELNCSVEEYLGHDNATKWSLEQGYYHNNGYCSNELVILNATEVYITSQYFAVEPYVDYIKYSIDNETTSEIFYDAPDIAFTAYKNGSEKHLLFEFISDGSFFAPGFKIIFTVYDCKCAKKTVKCNHISGITEDSNYHYCSNMKCKFILKPCKTAITVLSITANFEKNLLDVFKVISNNIVVFTLSEYSGYSQADDGYIIYLNSSSYNVFDVTTYLSSGDKSLHFSTKPFKVPKVVTTTLSLSMPLAIIETNSHKNILYEITKSADSRNTTYVMYKNNNALINIYNNKSLTFNLRNKDCFSTLNPFKCVITNDKFVVHVVEDEPSPFLAIRLSNIQNGCVFSENIFAVYDETISALANINGECFLTILISKPGGPTFQSFWTTSKKENVQVFIGTDQTKLLFEFNSITAPKWYIIPFSNIYTIKIPKLAALLINYKSEALAARNKTYNSIITTPGYGTSSIPWSEATDLPFEEYSYDKYSEIKFTVLEMKLARKNQFYFLVGALGSNIKIHVNKTGDVVILKKQTVGLIYNSTKPNNYVKLFVEIVF